MSDTYTIKELSHVCNCSKVTVKKHLNDKGLKSVISKDDKRKTARYTLNKFELKALIDEINDNKSTLTKGSNFVVKTASLNDNISEVIKKPLQPIQRVDNTSIESFNWFKKYQDIFVEYTELKSNQKLLTQDLATKEGIYVNEINSLKSSNNELKSINQRINKQNIRLIISLCLSVGALVSSIILFLFFNVQ